MLKRLFLAATLLFAALPAHATPVILASCSEDVSCVFQGTVSVVTAAGKFDSSNARFSLSVLNATGTSPATNRIQTNTFSSASANFWLSATYNTGSSSTGAGHTFVGFNDGSTLRLLLRATGTAQQIKITTRNAAGTLVDLATATGSICATGSLCKLDIHVVYAAAGSVDVYNNGTLIATYSGDVTTNSATTLSQAEFGTLVNNFAISWSEMFASDTDTRSMISVTCAPSGTGATQNWTGSAGNINANSYSDATFNYTITNNDLSQWATGCTIPTLATILDVRSYGRVAIGGSGPQNARFSMHVGGGDQDNGSDLSGLTTSFGNLRYDWGANSPTSGTAWTRSDLATGFSFGVKSRP